MHLVRLSSGPLAACLFVLFSAPAIGAESAPIPISEIGAKVSADYQGDAIGVRATPEGARLRTQFQKLAGTVTREGLRLESTAEGGGGLRLVAQALGRGGRMAALPATGAVEVEEKVVSFRRPGLTEEYSASVDGLRQDFVVATRPAGEGSELCVELALIGARAGAAASGVRLVLDGSGRALAYARLRVTDAAGRVLSARLEVLAADLLAVCVTDVGAAYPVRIDPTFSDANWMSLSSGIPGVNNLVRASAVDGSGNLYIGGDFTFAGTVAANRVAKWNGTAWSALGSGIGSTSTSEQVSALAVLGTDLYAGGDFLSAGGINANRIARWNGTAWSALGTGMNDTVFALVASGGNLYVGGQFTTAGGINANRIARWNGTAWSALGTGTSGPVGALAASGTDLYAGGGFAAAGGVSASNVARWNGTAWSALGSGVTGGFVQALAVSGTNLYAGGVFTAAGGVPASNVARWNGSAWSALGAGVDDADQVPAVKSLVANGSDLYVGGFFSLAGNAPASNVARWNGMAWSTLGAGLNTDSNPAVSTLAFFGSNLFAGGTLSVAGGAPASNVARWNGTAWSALGSGTNDGVRALVRIGTDIYAGGAFNIIGGVPASRVARWNGTAWSPLGSGIGGYAPVVSSLATNGSDLYAAGSFSVAGGAPASNVARWDGTAWSPLGSGITGAHAFVAALAVIGTDVYAAGSFPTAGGAPAVNIARWNGTAWSPLGSGLGQFDFDLRYAYSLAVVGTDLYAGGGFTTAGGAPAKGIARWNGTTWSALGAGIDSEFSSTVYVAAMAVSGTDLYVGGSFTLAGGASAKNVARWNGAAWSALGLGINDGNVNALALSRGNLYAGGSFNSTTTASGSVVLNSIAKWDGVTWSALGSGISTPVPGGNVGVSALLSDAPDRLYVGGNFITVGGTTLSPFIARTRLPVPDIAVSQGGPLVDGTSTVSFGSAGTGGANPQQRIFTITNPGDDDLTSLAVTKDGPNAADFSVGTPSGANVPVGSGSVTFTVTFSPAVGGARTAAIHVASNVPGAKNPFDINLSGTGVAAPSGLGYGTNPATYTKGTVIAANNPSLSGGDPATSYSVAPALPAGLALNPTTGVITGTPTAITATANYTVIAVNLGGSTSVPLSITVNDAAPTSLAYAVNPATYVRNTAIAANNPSNAGGAITSYGVSPALPIGLALNTSTGAITGTPFATRPTAAYTVTGTNVSGSTTVTLTITVNSAPDFSSADSTIFTVGVPGSFLVTAFGQPAPTFSSTGPLPSGVTFTTAGLLSGTPAVGTSGNFALTLMATNGINPNATQSFTLTINRPPVANADALAATRNHAVSRAASVFLANDTDADGDVRTLTSAGPASTQGGTVALAAGIVTYTPALNFVGADVFTYTISDGRGGTAAGLVNVTVSDSFSRLLSVAPEAGGVRVRWQGVAGTVYTIEHSEGLTGAWTAFPGTVTAPAGGIVDYLDTTTPRPAERFFRLVVP